MVLVRCDMHLRRFLMSHDMKFSYVINSYVNYVQAWKLYSISKEYMISKAYLLANIVLKGYPTVITQYDDDDISHIGIRASSTKTS